MKNSLKKTLTLSFLLLAINTYANSLYDAIINNNYTQVAHELQTNNFTPQEKSLALIEALSIFNPTPIDIQDNIVRLIIESDIDINLQQPHLHNTILHNVLIKQYNNEIIEQILNKNPNLNLQNIDNYTPIHFALLYNYNERVIKLLLSKNIDVNIQNFYGKTLLHIALYNEYSSEIIEQILNKSPNLSLQDIHGNTPIDIIFERLNKNSLQYNPDTEKSTQYISLLLKKIYNNFNKDKWTQAILIKTTEVFVETDSNRSHLKQILKNIIKSGLNPTLKTSNLNGLNIVEYYQCIHKYLTLYTQSALNSNNNNNLNYNLLYLIAFIFPSYLNNYLTPMEKTNIYISQKLNTMRIFISFFKIIEKLKLIEQELASKTSEEQREYCLKLKDRVLEVLQVLQEGTMADSIEKIFDQPLKQELYS